MFMLNYEVFSIVVSTVTIVGQMKCACNYAYAEEEYKQEETHKL